MALAVAEEKKLQPQEMSVTLTRSRAGRNKWMEVCDQVLACISRASVLSLERGGPAPTATLSLWALKMLLDPGFWDCPLRWWVLFFSHSRFSLNHLQLYPNNYIQEPDTTSSISGDTVLRDSSIPLGLTSGLEQNSIQWWGWVESVHIWLKATCRRSSQRPWAFLLRPSAVWVVPMQLKEGNLLYTDFDVNHISKMISW